MNALIVFAASYVFLLGPVIVAWAWWTGTPRVRELIWKRGLIMGIASLVMAGIASMVYHETRPFVMDPAQPLVKHAANNSFPSHHGLLAFGCAFLLLPISPRAAYAALVVAAVVSIGRIMAELHNPTDILASIVVALIGNLIAVAVIKPSRRRYQY